MTRVHQASNEGRPACIHEKRTWPIWPSAIQRSSIFDNLPPRLGSPAVDYSLGLFRLETARVVPAIQRSVVIEESVSLIDGLRDHVAPDVRHPLLIAGP